MKEFLKRIKLIDHVRFELRISRADFANTLQANIEEPGSDFADLFSRTKKIFKGKVSHDSFELKRIRKLFGAKAMWAAKVQGKFTSSGDKLVVDIEINGVTPLMIPYAIFTVIVYVGSLAAVFLSEGMSDTLKASFVPFLLFHAALMFGLPYFTIRRSLASVKYDIERDIHFMMKDKISRASTVDQ